MAGQGRPLDEAEYLIDTKPTTPAKSSARKPKIEPASPMSKRNLQLLRRGPLDLPPPTPEVEEPVQDEIVNHYLSQNMPEPEPPREKTPEPAAPNATVQQPDVTSDVTEQPTEEIEQIFRGIKIEVQGLDEEAICELGAEVGAAGGALAAAGAGGSHALVPMDFDPSELVTRDAEAVTVFWVSAAGAGGSHALVPMDFDPCELVTRDAEAVTVFWVSAAGAGGSHALVPMDFDPSELVTRDAEAVTVFWVVSF
ncbi:uncharacterized protein LOC135085651 [Ostrinia nubilalis]|uniref:uncharacterized protein LOC135085651 n=1 Tax=Ostrinia nubilalis TaxID=29057 RepID=UPI0030825C12